MNIEQRNLTIRKAVIFIFYWLTMYYLAIFLQFIIARILYPNLNLVMIEDWPQEALMHISFASNFYIYAFLTLIFLVVLWPYYREEWAIFKYNLSQNIRAGISFYFIAIIVSSVINLILAIIGITVKDSQNQEIIANAMEGYAYYMVPAVLMAPFVEETIFRGLIFDFFNRTKLNEKQKTILSFATSIFLFAIIHVLAELFQNPLDALVTGIPYIVMGVVLCTVYYKTKSLFAAVLTHFLQNFIASILLLLLNWLEVAPPSLESTGFHFIQELLQAVSINILG